MAGFFTAGAALILEVAIVATDFLPLMGEFTEVSPIF